MSDRTALAEPSAGPAAWRAPWLSMLIVAGAILGAGLGQGDLRLDGALYGWFAKRMAMTGDWLNLYFDWGDTHYFKKPPLLFWMAAGLFEIFGVNDRSAKAISAGFGVAAVAALYRLCRTRLSPDQAATAGIVLVTSHTFIRNTLGFRLDSALTFFMLVALACGVRLLDGRDRAAGPWLGLGLALGLGFMTKGAAVLAVIPVLVPAAIWAGRARLLVNPRLILAMLVAIAIAAPWHLQQYLTWGREFVDGYFGRENLARFTSDTHGTSPWYFYLRELGVYYWPWLPLVVMGAIALVRSGRWRGDAAVKLLVVWIVVELVLIHLVQRKYDRYLVPLLPALAILGALGWQLTPWWNGWCRRVLPNLGWAAAAIWLLLEVGNVRLHRTSVPELHVVAPFIDEQVTVPGEPLVHVYGPVELAFRCNLMFYTDSGYLDADDEALATIPSGRFVMAPVRQARRVERRLPEHVELYRGERFVFYRVVGGRWNERHEGREGSVRKSRYIRNGRPRRYTSRRPRISRARSGRPVPSAAAAARAAVAIASSSRFASA